MSSLVGSFWNSLQKRIEIPEQMCVYMCVSVYYVQENVYLCDTVCTCICVECVPGGGWYWDIDFGIQKCKVHDINDWKWHRKTVLLKQNWKCFAKKHLISTEKVFHSVDPFILSLSYYRLLERKIFMKGNCLWRESTGWSPYKEVFC